MKNMILLTLVLASSFASHAAIIMDKYRKEVRELTLKNHHPSTSYRESRYELLQHVALDKDERGYFIQDVYCDLKIRSQVGPSDIPNHTILNVEHTWPRSRFNRSENRGIQEADLHHLYPTQSQANGTRGNHNFYDFNAHGFSLNGCQISETGTIPESGELGFEPPDFHKGNAARALFYFSIRYNIEIPDYEEKVLRKWHKADPVDEDERERNKRIQKFQGNTNPFIDDPALVDLITNF